MGFLSKLNKTVGIGSFGKSGSIGGLLSGGGGGSSGGIPKWVSKAGMENYDFAKEIAAKPLQQFQGERVAGFSPFQEQAFNQIGQLGGAGAGLAQKGFNILGGIGSAADRISAYQNPFTSEVIDRSLADLERQRQISGQVDASKAIAARAFGGSRQAVNDALTNEAYARQAGDLASNLRFQSFNTALGAAQNDVQQQQQLAQALQQAGYGAIDALGQAGGMQQQLSQAQIDAEREKFAEQRDYPLQQLAIRQSALGQTPYNVQPYQPKPDRTSQLLQGAGTVAGIAALFSDKNMKEKIKPVRGTNILNKIDSMPISEWQYKEAEGLGTDRHIGPMAQDFAKQIAGDGKTIDVATGLGTSLLGIQELSKRVKKLEKK